MRAVADGFPADGAAGASAGASSASSPARRVPGGDIDIDDDFDGDAV
jgi:hypothetical protein